MRIDGVVFKSRLDVAYCSPASPRHERDARRIHFCTCLIRVWTLIVRVLAGRVPQPQQRTAPVYLPAPRHTGRFLSQLSRLGTIPIASPRSDSQGLEVCVWAKAGRRLAVSTDNPTDSTLRASTCRVLGCMGTVGFRAKRRIFSCPGSRLAILFNFDRSRSSGSQ